MLELVARYSNVTLLQNCTHSLGSDGPLWVGGEFADFVKLWLESLVETKMFLLGLPRACPSNRRAVWSRDLCAWECIEIHLGNTSTKVILGSLFLLHKENVMENANIKCCNAAGVRRCNTTTTLSISLYWMLVANSLFQICWLWLPQLLEKQLLQLHWIGLYCQSRLSLVFKKWVRKQSQRMEVRGGLYCGFTFLSETQRLGQCLSQSTET